MDKRLDPKDFYDQWGTLKFSSPGVGSMTKRLTESNYSNQLVTEFALGTIYNKKAFKQGGTKIKTIKMHPGTTVPRVKSLFNTPIKSPQGIIVRQPPLSSFGPKMKLDFTNK